MNRSKTHLLTLGLLVVAIGVSIEGLKKLGLNTQTKSDLQNQALDIGHYELRPFHQKASLRDEAVSKSNKFHKSLNNGIRVKGLGQPLDLEKAHTFKKVKKKKKKKDNKKQAKKGKKKDKKKKKKELKVAEKDAKYNEVTEDDFDRKNKDSDQETANGYPGGAYFQAPTNTAAADIPIDAQEWVDFVLKSPSLTKVTKLIDYYQSNLLTPQVFYAVVTAMLEDPRSEVNDYAVLALGSSPSITSFKMLVDIRQTDAFNDFLRSKADVRLTNYQAISRLGVLQTVLSMNNNEIGYVAAAAKELRGSTEKYISVSRDPSDTKSSESSLSQHQARLYQGFVKILEKIINEYQNSGELINHAEIALEKIKSIPSEDQIN